MDRRVTIVGGGVAALEALLALRALAGDRVAIELISAKPQFSYRPLAVAEPFGLGEAHQFDLTRIAAQNDATLHVAGVHEVDTEKRQLVTWDGRRHDYDVLVMAIGATPGVAVPGSVSLSGPAYTSRFRTVLRELDKRHIFTLAFAVPLSASWPLPLYELALMTAAHVAERGLHKAQLHLVTHESEPLELFGLGASAAVRELLEQRNVTLHTDRAPVKARAGELITAPGPALAVDRVVSLPRLEGPRIAGLPADRDGFIAVDLHGRVRGLDDVYAAGDATTFPIKQGGIAAQQADVVAEAIAASAGAGLEPQPFRPVLRGLLLTGGTPRYLRAEVTGGRGDAWDASEHALWWPPSKIAGRYLAPYLATQRDELDATRQRVDVEVELDPESPAPRRRAIVASGPDRGALAIGLDD